jgi:hypothetical protein
MREVVEGLDRPAQKCVLLILFHHILTLLWSEITMIGNR